MNIVMASALAGGDVYHLLEGVEGVFTHFLLGLWRRKCVLIIVTSLTAMEVYIFSAFLGTREVAEVAEVTREYTITV